jgi:large subunit ribosomal protein L25
MMEKEVLKATKRTVTGKQVKQLRRAGQIPAVIYGHHVEPVVISLDAHDATLSLSRVSSSTLITINVEGTEYPTLVREKQRDFIRNVLTHVDFLAVSLKEKLRAEVSIELTGISAAVKDFNAILVNGLTTLTVECLPSDLPEKFVVDISNLAVIGNGIHVRDIPAPENVKIMDDGDEMIVVATAPAKEEVVEVAAVVPVEGEEGEPEVIEKGKKEEEEGEESGSKS